ncbi:efflux RND transporter permease subunit [Thermoflavimicrobium daqui]|uniref:AcrB/AcrD/AcrF family protein n=1 Tax=Thermoflavimicrobium daqui TaxID=2137476 RepID=A0A364K3E5_9BACL|nr:efflux RND transporter permease subunit [Thermoflavimicrobium daqui]RAL23343.1 AcrB/AcrD/AcrF family protein [Thermoflavimicrobium daqui]
MSRLTNWSLKNGTAIIILCILILVGGFFSMTQIKQEIMPNVSFPSLWIQINTPGQSAEDNEKEITKTLEDQILASNEAEEVLSTTSSQGVSLEVKYPYGTDLDKAKNKLESIINGLKLPEQSESMVSGSESANNLVSYFALTSKNYDQLQKKVEDKILPEIKKVNGVAKVDISGLKERKWIIELNESKAKSKGISTQDIKQALNNKNINSTVGIVENKGKTIPIDINESIKNVNDLKKVTVMSSQTSAMSDPKALAPVKLGDIATIKQSNEAEEISRINGEHSLVIIVNKETKANTVQVAKSVEKVINKYKTQDKFNVFTLANLGKEIETSISKLVKEGLFGALFTVVVIAIFLRSFRATMISIISLPISIFVTIFLLDKMGYTLNVMSLGGLAVAIGRIVDDSIVVIENIYRWIQEKGDRLSRKEITIRATKEVMTAVASSTFVTCVVFLPIAFIGGFVGELFRPFSFAVAFSILASLLVAIMLIPLLGKRFFTKVKHKEEDGKLVHGYEKLLRGALNRKGLVLTLSVILLIASFFLVPMLGFSLMPAGSSTNLSVTLKLPKKASLEQTDKITQKIEDYLKKRKEVEYSSAEVGLQNEKRVDNEARIVVKLKKGYNADQMMGSLQKEVSNLVKAEMSDSTVKVEEFGQGNAAEGNNVDIEMYSENQFALEKAAKLVEELLSKNDQLKNVKNEMNEVQTKWTLELNQKGRDMGLDLQQLSMMIAERIHPVEIVDYKIGQEKMDLTVRYKEKIDTKAKLLNTKILTPSGEKALKEVAKVNDNKTPIAINRQDGRTLATVTAQVKGQDVRGVTEAVKADVSNLKLPEGVQVKTGGGSEQIDEEFSQMGMAMLIAVGLVFFILSMTFNGILTPIVILTSILFVPVGSFSFLLITKQSLSLSAMIGLLMLIGIVVTNAVVLLDRVETNRKNGMEINDAIVEAGKVRLRPILMTAVATICALIPLALSGDVESVSAALISKGLAITVIGGLTTSTLLTLIVVPSLYRALEKFRRNKEELQPKKNHLPNLSNVVGS